MSESIDYLEIIKKFDADTKTASKVLRPSEVRFFTRLYKQIQNDRIRGGHQLMKAKREGEPNLVITWFFNATRMLEDNCKKLLDVYTDEWMVGRWQKSIVGIGPIFSATNLSHFDIRRSKTVGHFWAYGGQDPTRVWEKGTTRPFNAHLKSMLYLLGQSFVKVQSNKNDFYGKLYVERRIYEDAKNENKDYADQAAKSLKEKHYGKDTIAREWYEKGMLPPARMLIRSARWSMKLFLSHLHHVMHVDFYGKEPMIPFAFDKCPGDHRHYIPPPNFPFNGGGRSLKEYYTEPTVVAEQEDRVTSVDPSTYHPDE